MINILWRPSRTPTGRLRTEHFEHRSERSVTGPQKRSVGLASQKRLVCKTVGQTVLIQTVVFLHPTVGPSPPSFGVARSKPLCGWFLEGLDIQFLQANTDLFVAVTGEDYLASSSCNLNSMSESMGRMPGECLQLNLC